MWQLPPRRTTGIIIVCLQFLLKGKIMEFQGTRRRFSSSQREIFENIVFNKKIQGREESQVNGTISPDKCRSSGTKRKRKDNPSRYAFSSPESSKRFQYYYWRYDHIDSHKMTRAAASSLRIRFSIRERIALSALTLIETLRFSASLSDVDPSRSEELYNLWVWNYRMWKSATRLWKVWVADRRNDWVSDASS